MGSKIQRCPVCNTPDELVANLLVSICRSCADEYGSCFEGIPGEAEPDCGGVDRKRKLADNDKQKIEAENDL